MGRSDGVHKNHILPNDNVEVRKKINYYRLKYVAKRQVFRATFLRKL